MALEPVKTLPEANTYYTRLSIGPYVRGAAFALSEFDERLVVHLPLPTELRDDTSVSYTNVNLETVGDAFLGRGEGQGLFNAAVARNTGQLVSGGLSATSRGFGSMLDGRGIMGQATSALSGGLIGSVQSLLSPEQINSAVQQKSGVAPNPNPSVQFQGPVLRDFTLTWAFYPKNAGESRKIDGLIRKLKGRALPSNNRGNDGAILNYPHICQLNFFPWDSNSTGSHPNGWSESSIIKIKKCFMSGVNVNYNAFGTPGFFEGTRLPISYQLTINFKEIEYLLSDDWDASAAGERANTSFNAATALTGAASLVFETAANVIEGTLTTAGDIIAGNYTSSSETEVQNDDNSRDALEGLKDNDDASRLVISVNPGWFSRIFAGATGPTTYTATKVDGKYQLVVQGSPIASETGPITPSPTTRTFDSEAQLRDFLREEGVYRNGTQTEPPLPEAAAAAPAAEE